MMRLRLLLVLMVLGAMVSAIPSASAHPMKPVACDIYFEFDGVKYAGEVSNCEFAGYAEAYVIEAVFPGPTPDVPFSSNTEHWVGATIIWPDSGGTIVSLENGFWTLNDRADLCSFDECLKYRTNGQVVEEVTIGDVIYHTDGYNELIGARTHGMGHTSQFPPPPEETFRAEQTLRFN